MTSTTRPERVGRTVGRQHARVAREREAFYDAGDGRLRSDVRRDGDGRGAIGGEEPGTADEGSPLGVPLLAEVPDLADPLQAYVEADRLMVRMVLGLAALLEQDQDVSVEATGVGVEHWLALTAGSPRLERRTWLRAARLLLRLPKLRGQAEIGLVSAGQLRALTVALRGVPATIDVPLDDWLADASAELHRLQADPDAIVDQARCAVEELTDQTEVTEDDANRARSLHLQPRLDGSGGTFRGDEDAYGFAILEAATRPRPDQTELDIGRARADNLQALLHGVRPDASDDTPVTPAGDDRGVAHGSWAEAMADAARLDVAYRQGLADLPELGQRIAGYADAGRMTPPKVLLRAELSTLLEGGRIPASLLTTLAGGQLRVTSTAARTLLDAHGADLRLIIVDHGEVVGVGRAARRPPGWVTDAILSIHDHCTGALCDRAAAGADIDHAVAWHPTADCPTAGRTDLDNLGPLCRHTNRNRAAMGWRPRQHGTDGIRTWTHQRTGLQTSSVPATWRPPSRGPTRTPGAVRSRSWNDPGSGVADDDDFPF